MRRAAQVVALAASALHLESAFLPTGVPRDLGQRLACLWFGLTVVGQLWCWPLALALAWRSAAFAALLALYLAYIIGPGMRAAEEEGPAPLRRLGIWKLMGRRFGARLIKTADLGPGGRYLLACHPHGVSSISGFLMFGTEAAGFSDVFPGLRPWPCTLESNFRAPFIREWVLLHGGRSCARRALEKLLSRPGAAVALFPGGASESVATAEGGADVILDRRRGFVKVALATGASLVPVGCFGETDLFHTHRPEPGSFGHWFRPVSHRVLPGRQPLFWGDGVFTNHGLLPLARPLATVVGAPIRVEKWEGPQEGPAWHAAVDGLHAEYRDALEALWGAWRGKAVRGRLYAPLCVVG